MIENEFGAISIDEQLVKENLKVAEEVISLDNGCACCTVRGDLMKALTQLKDRKNDFDMVSCRACPPPTTLPTNPTYNPLPYL